MFQREKQAGEWGDGPKTDGRKLQTTTASPFAKSVFRRASPLPSTRALRAALRAVRV